MSKSVVLSCIQPSGELHIGNYFGAVSDWVKLQDDYRCIYGIVDLHAMTKPPYDPEALRLRTEQIAVDLLACGIDPEKSLLFIQSLVPEHTELCWILSCVCSYGDLTRQTQFKDLTEAFGEGRLVSAGLFGYPVLQAADILIYKADYVPVGKDQEQHLELAREIARRFNGYFGAFFREPEVLPTLTPKIRSTADPLRKMSKSLGPNHYIGLFEEPESVAAKIRTAVTDTGVPPPGVHMSPGVENLFEIIRACGDMEAYETLKSDYDAGIRRYSGLKDAVVAALLKTTDPLRARREEISRNPAAVREMIREMSEKARRIAAETLREVRERVGLPPPIRTL
jgi:tryptophanyl-tRNA synthetase